MRVNYKLTAFILGVLSLTLQIILLREILQLFLGNELTIGLSLAVWLLGTTLGALILPRYLRSDAVWHYPTLLIFPVTLISYFFIHLSPKIFHFIPGVPQDSGTTLIITLLAILPTAVLCGFLFPYAVKNLFYGQGHSATARIKSVYILESLGAMAAALVLNLILFKFINNFQILLISLLLFGVILLSIGNRIFPGIGLKILLYGFVTLLIILLMFHQPVIDHLNRAVLNPYQVVKDQETPYGNHKLLKLEEQTVVLSQGIIEYSQPDVYSAEINMLLPLLLHTQAENILVIGGDLSGLIESTGPLIVGKKIVYLEKDPFLLNYQKQLVKQLPQPGKTSLRFVQSDIRHFFNETDDTFDVICLNKPEPFTLAENRFYTREFYQMIKRQLKPEGILLFSVRSSENFINPALANYLNLYRNTLLTAFKNVSIIPGDDAVFLASPERVFTTLLTDLSDNIITQKVNPQYLTILYLSYRLSAERISAFNDRLAQFDQQIINSDYNVKGYIYHYQIWGWISDPVFNEIFLFLSDWSRYIIPAMLLLFVSGILLVRRKPAALLLLSLSLIGGYAVALEIIFILQYQILYGSIYTGLAVIFGIFMMGLSAGAEILDRKKDLAANSRFSQWVLAGFALLTAILFIPVYTSGALGQSVIFKWGIGPIYVLLLGILTGAYFSYITGMYYQVSQKSEIGITYGVDLFGGMVSSFLVSVFLIPLLEISGVLILLLLMMGFQVVLQK